MARIVTSALTAAVLLIPALASGQDHSEATLGIERGRAAEGSERALGAGEASGRAPGTKTVAVDCAAGQSIMKALENKAEELIVEISGLCAEDVEVRRDRVTFRGTDPTVDGIQAVGTADPFGAALLVREARFITIENLQFTNATRAGLRVENARRNVSVSNCRFENNGGFGVVALGSLVDAVDSVATGNAIAGIAASENSFVLCDNCSVFDNPAAGDGIGVISSLASSVNFVNSSIAAQFAIDVEASSFGTFTDSILTGEELPSGFGLAVFVSDNGSATVRDSTLAGSIQVSDQGQLFVQRSTQTANPIGNFVTGQSKIETFGSPTTDTDLIGTTSLSQFANGVFSSFTNLGDLTCSIGSDAFCSGGVTKNSSTCGLCP